MQKCSIIIDTIMLTIAICEITKYHRSCTDAYTTNVEIDGVLCSLEVLDTAGQEVCAFILMRF